MGVSWSSAMLMARATKGLRSSGRAMGPGLDMSAPTPTPASISDDESCMVTYGDVGFSGSRNLMHIQLAAITRPRRSVSVPTAKMVGESTLPRTT